MRPTTLSAAVLLLSAALSAAKVDARLYTAKTAFVMPMDDLSDDKPVSACFAQHMASHLPLALAESREAADLVIKVKANVPSATKRALTGMMGGTPSGHVYAELADGTKLWDDGAKLRRAILVDGQLVPTNGANTVECGIADELIDTLRDAMKKARDRK